MASENLIFRASTHPGFETRGSSARTLRFAPTELRDAYKPSVGTARATNNIQFLKYNPEHYQTDTITATLASGTAATGAAGLVITSHIHSGDEACLSGVLTRAMVLGDIYYASIRFKMTDNANAKFLFGIGQAAATTPLTTAPADGVYLWTDTAGTLIGSVVSPTHAIANSATLSTMTNSEEIEAGLVFCDEANSTGHQWGYFWVYDSGVLTKTDFTELQLDQLYHMYATTLPTLKAHCSIRTAEGAANVLTVDYMDAGVLL